MDLANWVSFIASHILVLAQVDAYCRVCKGGLDWDWAMPTVVLMDVSLSMTRPVSLDGSEEFQRKNLAVHGLNMLFEHMASNYRLEFTALMAFSSLWELLVPFTRDYNALQVKPDTIMAGVLSSVSLCWHYYFDFWKAGFVFHFHSFTSQEALSSLEDYDKTCIEAALNGVNNVVQQEWGSGCPCQVLWNFNKKLFKKKKPLHLLKNLIITLMFNLSDNALYIQL